MKNKIEHPQTPSQESNKKKQRILLVFLVITAMVSSVISGILIGRNTNSYRGQILDTIVIGSDETRKVHVSGQVLYTNGDPYKNGKIELRSEPRVSSTNSKGQFFYESVEPGKHTLSIVDESATILAKCQFEVSQSSKNQAIDIKKQKEGAYSVDLSVDVRFIELAVEIDMDHKVLNLIPEKTAVLLDDGTLSVDGKTLNVTEGAVVLPSTTVILTDKTVVITDSLILPNNEVTSIPKEGYRNDLGEKVEKNGDVVFIDGSKATSNGVKKADGSLVQPNEAYQIKYESSKTSNGENPTDSSELNKDTAKSEQTQNADSDSKKENNSGTTPLKPDKTKPEVPDTNDQPSVPDTPDNPNTPDTPVTPDKPDIPDDPIIKPEVEDHGILEAKSETTNGWKDWLSVSTIDLFRRRNNTADNGSIQPGSHGYYMFKLENGRSKDLSISLQLSETDMHLPLSFTLTPLDENGNQLSKLAVSGSLKNNNVMTLKGRIGAKTSTVYRLDWKWPVAGNDAEDTKAGLSGGSYKLSLRIHAEDN